MTFWRIQDSRTCWEFQRLNKSDFHMGKFPQEPLRDTQKPRSIPTANEALIVYRRSLLQEFSPFLFIHSPFIALRKPLIRLRLEARTRCEVKRGRFGGVPLMPHVPGGEVALFPFSL
jgi:hypothetical protein